MRQSGQVKAALFMAALFMATFFVGLLLYSSLVAAAEAQRWEGELPELRELEPLELDTDNFQRLLEEELNCHVRELSAPGQALHVSGSALHVSGSVGGLLPHPNPNMAFSILLPADNPDLAAFLPEQHHANVAILVVDDFNGIYDLGFDMLVGHGWPDVVQTLNDPSGSTFSHGALVLHHLNTLIEQTENYALTRPRQDVFVWQHQSGHQLLIVAVDIASNPATPATTSASTTATIVAELEAAIAAIGQDDGLVPGIEAAEAVVVNMSFVLLPCAVLEDFLASGISTFDAYTAALMLAASLDPDDQAAFEAFSRLITTPLEITRRDPLHCLVAFQEQDDAPRSNEERLPCFIDVGNWPQHATFVAAAGNLNDLNDRLPFSLYPAAWEGVIGVSARDDHGARGDFSNPGQVMATGAWFALHDGSSGLAYAGTSFSAPAVTVAVAMREACAPSHLATWHDTPIDVALGMLCP